MLGRKILVLVALGALAGLSASAEDRSAEKVIRSGGGRVIRFGKKFTDVAFTDPKTFDAGVLVHLVDVPRLERLTFRGIELKDADLKHLSKLRGLRHLFLTSKTIGDEGMEHLAGLANLRSLELHITQVTA